MFPPQALCLVSGADIVAKARVGHDEVLANKSGDDEAARRRRLRVVLDHFLYQADPLVRDIPFFGYCEPLDEMDTRFSLPRGGCFAVVACTTLLLDSHRHFEI